MGLTPSVRFGHHGTNRAKFIEVRRQDGGLVIPLCQTCCRVRFFEG